MPPDDHSHTRPSPINEGDPLLEFPSEPQGRIVTPHSLSKTIVAPPQQSDGDSAPVNRGRIVLVETKNLSESLLQFLPEAPEAPVGREDVCPPDVRPVPQIKIKRLRPQGVKGTERFDEAALVKAKGKPFSVGRVLAVGMNPARPHSVRMSLALFVAAAPVAIALVLLALHAATVETPQTATTARPAQASGEPRPSPTQVGSAPERVPAIRPESPFTASPAEPIDATVTISEAPSTPPTTAAPPPASTSSVASPVSKTIETAGTAEFPQPNVNEPTQLPPVARPPSVVLPFRGSLAVTSAPEGAQVLLNDVVVGITPLLLLDVVVGSRVVRVELEGHDRWSSVVRIVANQRTTATAVLQPLRIQ